MDDAIDVKNLLSTLSKRDRIIVVMHCGYAVPEGYNGIGVPSYQDIADYVNSKKLGRHISAEGVKKLLTRLKADWRKKYAEPFTNVRAA